MLKTTTGVCACGVTDETDVAETCTDVNWISLVACASGVTGETILAWTSSGVDEKTRVACTMGVTEKTVIAWSCTEVGGTTCVAGASVVAGTRVVSSCGVLEVCSKPNDGKKKKCHRVVTNNKKLSLVATVKLTSVTANHR